MTPDRWHAITDIFHAAVERDAAVRDAFLVEACKADASLRAEVEALLAAHRDAASFGKPVFAIPGALQLAPGARLGPYRIEALIGAGGMGEVYRARDLRLDRSVALKILPPHLRHSPDLQARFKREARLISRLTHPNICTLHDIGRDGDIDFLVMEQLDGETLAARLTRGAVPLEQALKIGIEIATALAHAHRHGVLHRDLKPSNVMLTRSGAKLLDFGLAKLRATIGAVTQSAQTTRFDETAEATLLGTLAYMAPEQLERREADARADIWALGCVIYELATGHRAFKGMSQASLIAAILAHEPAPLAELQPLAPPLLDHIIRTCLAKDREERWQSADDVVRELQWIAKPVEVPSLPSDARRKRRLHSRFAVPLLISTAVLTLALVVGAWRMSRLTPATDEPSFQIATAVTWPSADSNGRLSPDGSWLSFISDRDGDPRLFVRNLKSGETTTVAAPGGGVLGQTWSPDGQELALLLRQGQTVTLQIVPAFFGGPSRTVAQIAEPARLVRWIGTTAYVEHRFNLLGVDMESGAIAENLRPDQAKFPVAHGFDVSPDGRIAFSAQLDGNDDIWLTDTHGSPPVRLTNHAASDLQPVLAGDYLFFHSSRSGQADVWRLHLTDQTITQLTRGDGELLPEGATADGRLLSVGYVATGAEIWAMETSTRRAWAVTSESVQDLWPSLSRNGTVIAYQRRKRTIDTSYVEGEAEIVVGRWDGARIGQSRVAVATGFGPRVSPDGRWLAYLEWGQGASNAVVLKVQDLVASRTVTVTDRFRMAGYFVYPPDWLAVDLRWSEDGSELLFCERDPVGISRIAAFAPGAPGALREIVALPKSNAVARDVWVSDTGRHLAYIRYDVATSVLVVRDLSTSIEQEWLTDRHGRQGRLQLIGWDGVRLLAVRSRRTEGLPQSLDILAVEGPTRHIVLRQHPQGYAATARFDRRERRVLVTLREQGADNLFALPLDSGIPVRLTSNDRASVTFSNVELMRSDRSSTILYARHDRRQDIWLVRDAARR